MDELRTDEELIAGYLAGEETAFERLVERYQARLIAFAYSILENHNDAEDVVQDTWLYVWQHLREHDPTRKFSSWLYKICQNECLMLLRKKHRKLEVPLPEDIDEIKSTGLREAAKNKEAREWCLAVLKHRQRRLFDLVVREGKKYEEILTYEKEFCPVEPGVPLEIKPEHIEALRQEFAEVMEMVQARAKERVRRDRKAYQVDK